LVVWYDGNDPQACIVDALGPFGLDEALMRHLTDIDEAPYEVQINAAFEIPTVQPDAPGEYSILYPPVYKRLNEEAYPVYELQELSPEQMQFAADEREIPYYSLSES